MRRITIYYLMGGSQIISPTDAFDIYSNKSVKGLVFTIALTRVVSYILVDDGSEVRSIPLERRF